MTDFILSHYDWLKAFHVIAVISWMAGMLYLPRLYVYHADADKGSELSETLKIMERKLLRLIINPAMILSWIFGLALISATPEIFSSGGWLHVKLAAVILLQIFHAFLSRWRKAFLKDQNRHRASFYRKINEVPTLLMIVAVVMVIVKPF
jgi:putative membrane protein